MVDYVDWLKEAELDLVAAENLGQAKLYAAACFHCQQAVEKALKAFILFKKKTFSKTHSLRDLASQAGVLPDLRDLIAFTDADYAMTRYLDAAGKPPRVLYDYKTFKERLSTAQEALGLINKWISV